MVKNKKHNIKRGITNLFGGIGYFFVAMQWVWSVMLYSGVLISFVEFVRPNINDQKVVQLQNVDAGQAVNPIFIFFLAVLVFIVFVITVYALFKIPSATIKTAKSVVHQTAEYTTPIVLSAYHEKDTPVKHSRVKQILIAVFKLVIVLVPLVAGLLSYLLDHQKIDYYIAELACLWLAGFSILSFLVQYIIARIFSLKLRDLW